MAYMNVDVDLTDCDAHELIEALEYHSGCLRFSETRRLREIIKESEPSPIRPEQYNEYCEVIAALRDQFSVKELETMLRLPLHHDNERQMKFQLT